MKASIKKLVVAGSIAVTLVACGGGGGGDDAGGVSTVTVSPSLGRFSEGTQVQLLKLDGTVLASGTIGADGKAVFSISALNEAFVVKVKGGNGAKYFDEKTGQDVDFPAGEELRAVAPAGSTSLGVTPLTDAATRSLEAAAGGLTAADTTKIKQANNLIAAAFGLTDILTPPVLLKQGDSAVLDSDSGASKYALVLAALAQNGEAGKKAHEIAKDLARDFADGKLDGAAPDGQPITAINPTTFVNNFNTAVVAAATQFAKPVLLELVKADPLVVVAEPKPVDATQATAIALARKMFSDVRIAANLVDGRVVTVGEELRVAAAAVEDTSRLGIDQFRVVSRAAGFLRDLQNNWTRGAVQDPAKNNYWRKEFYPTEYLPAAPGQPYAPFMVCYSDNASAAGTTSVKCAYAKRTGRDANHPGQSSRFVIAVKDVGPVDGKTQYAWDAWKETSDDGSYSGTTPSANYTKIEFGNASSSGTPDGIITYNFAYRDNTNGSISVKGDMPFGFYALTDKHSLDMSGSIVTTSINDGAGSAAVTNMSGSLIRVLGDKTAKVELLSGSTISVTDPDANATTPEEGNETGSANLVVKGTVNGFTFDGSMQLTDTSALPTTAKIQASFAKDSVEVASVIYEAKQTALDLTHDNDRPAGSMSLTASVTSATGTVVKAVAVAARANAGDEVVAVSGSLAVGDRKLTISTSALDRVQTGVVTISNTDGVVVTLQRQDNGSVSGVVKTNGEEVGSINTNRANFKDGSTESLG